jgi:hypothetical protein
MNTWLTIAITASLAAVYIVTGNPWALTASILTPVIMIAASR